MRLVALTLAAALSITMLSSSSNVAHAAPLTETNTEAKTLKIQPGDSLSTIAEKNGSTIQRLFDANITIENPNLIYPGKDVRIPSKDEKIATRPMPVETTAEDTSVTEQALAPVQKRSQATAPAAVGGSVWDQLAQCESGGNWAINTGNGYYGGLQFSLSSWQAVGGSGLPSDASRDEQIMRGQMLQSLQGWGAWPACSAKLGLR